MNTRKLQQLVEESKFSKTQIAKKCGFSRMTLDNILNGGDTKISNLEILVNILGTTMGYLFDEQDAYSGNLTESPTTTRLRAEILLLQGENRVLREQLGLPARKETATRTA